MDNINKAVTFQELEGESFEYANICKGNACKYFGFRANYAPNSNYIHSLSVNNSGSGTIAFTIVWADGLGYCGTSNSDVVFPGETIEVFPGSNFILGYCEIKANFQTKEEEESNKTGAQCQFQGHTYNDGEITCINELDHRCRNGRWVRLGTQESCK